MSTGGGIRIVQNETRARSNSDEIISTGGSIRIVQDVTRARNNSEITSTGGSIRIVQDETRERSNGPPWSQGVPGPPMATRKRRSKFRNANYFRFSEGPKTGSRGICLQRLFRQNACLKSQKPQGSDQLRKKSLQGAEGYI